MPKVSVIIPVYCVEKYIERCARSLFEQTLDDIEYIFVDDCTPDQSIEIVKGVLEDYPRRKDQVIIHRMGKNSGQAAVRKQGIQMSTGDYIIHCDSDDWVDVDMYRVMYETAVQDDAEVVVCDYFETNGSGESKSTIQIVGCHNTDRDTFINNMLRRKDSWSLWNKLFSRSLFSNNIQFPECSMGEDLAIVLQLMIFCEKVSYVRKSLYYYCVNADSITRTIEKTVIINRAHQALNNVQLIIDIYTRMGLLDKFNYGLNFLKLDQKELLLPLLDNGEVYEYWYSTFPELKSQVIKMDIRWQIKLKYYLVMLGFGEVISWYKKLHL